MVETQNKNQHFIVGKQKIYIIMIVSQVFAKENKFMYFLYYTIEISFLLQYFVSLEELSAVNT